MSGSEYERLGYKLFRLPVIDSQIIMLLITVREQERSAHQRFDRQPV